MPVWNAIGSGSKACVAVLLAGNMSMSFVTGYIPVRMCEGIVMPWLECLGGLVVMP